MSAVQGSLVMLGGTRLGVEDWRGKIKHQELFTGFK